MGKISDCKQPFHVIKFEVILQLMVTSKLLVMVVDTVLAPSLRSLEVTE